MILSPQLGAVEIITDFSDPNCKKLELTFTRAHSSLKPLRDWMNVIGHITSKNSDSYSEGQIMDPTDWRQVSLKAVFDYNV